MSPLTLLRRRAPVALAGAALVAALAWAIPTGTGGDRLLFGYRRSGVPTTDGGGRSMWLWSRPDPDSLVTFAREQQVRRLYVHVPPTVDRADRAWLTRLHSRAERTGLSLWALGGDPGWLTRPQDAIAWQDNALDTGFFVGAHVDVEPHQLPAWDGQPHRRPALAAAHVELLRRMQQAKATPLEVDLPFWADEVTLADGQSWAGAAMREANLVTAMTYRDSADGIVAAGQRLLAIGSATGTPVQLALETEPVPDCDHCSFAGASAESVASTLAQVEAAGVRFPTFAGVAVHRHASWAALPPR